MSANKSKIEQFEYIKSYYTDLEIENQIVAVIVRSPVASGAIRSISHPNLPKGYTIITKKDLQWKTEIKILDAKIPLLAFENISYKGEAIALVCGPSIHLAKTISESLEIEYTEALENEKKLSEDYIYKRDEFSKEIVIQNDGKEARDAKEASEKKGKKEKESSKILTIKKTYKTKKKSEYFKESPGCLCDASEDSLTIFSPSLWVQNLLENVSEITNIDSESIYIKKTISNNRIESNIWAESYIACLASYASLILKKPVLLQIDKKDENLYLYNSPEFSTEFLASFTSEGIIKSLEVHCSIDCGAFPVFSDEIINRTKVASMGAYFIPNQKITIDILKSAKAPLSLDVNTIDSHAQFAIEVLMQDIAMSLNIFPHELRLKNLAQKDMSKLDFDNEKLNSLIHSTVERSGYFRRYASYNLVSKDSELFTKHKPSRGIGMSIGFKGSSFASSSLENKRKELSLTLNTDESVTIHTYTQSRQIALIWKEMASQELSISLDKILLDPYFAVLKDKFPSSIHNNINITTALIKKCAKEIESKRFHEALPIVAKKSILTQNTKNWNLKKLEGKPYYSTAWSSAVIDLEINTYSYEIIVKKVWVSIYAGKILNFEDAEKSVKRNVLQELSQYLPNERCINPSIAVNFIDSDEDPKEIGSLMDSLIASALHSALSLALQKPIPQLPLSHDSIFKLIGKEKR